MNYKTDPLKNKLVLVVLIALLLGGALWYFSQRQDRIEREESASIILNKIEEVNKLILVEGTFAEVYTYKQAENLLFNLIPVEKKVLVLVKATASVGYDLKKVDFVIDQDKKQVIIRNIPEVEIIIEPKIEYYDIQQSTFYPLDAKDLTTINSRAVELIRKQVKVSNLPAMAETRLSEVLEQLIFTSENLGWEVIKD